MSIYKQIRNYHFISNCYLSLRFKNNDTTTTKQHRTDDGEPKKKNKKKYGFKNITEPFQIERAYFKNALICPKTTETT